MVLPTLGLLLPVTSKLLALMVKTLGATLDSHTVVMAETACLAQVALDASPQQRTACPASMLEAMVPVEVEPLSLA
jgi:hypothetical protein